MPVKSIRAPEDVEADGKYRVMIDSVAMVALLVRIANEEGRYWTDIANDLIREGLKARGRWPIPPFSSFKEPPKE